jgi:hypothetical protein
LANPMDPPSQPAEFSRADIGGSNGKRKSRLVSEAQCRTAAR